MFATLSQSCKYVITTISLHGATNNSSFLTTEFVIGVCQMVLTKILVLMHSLGGVSDTEEGMCFVFSQINLS